MSRYHALLGRRVELEYRAGDIVLPATGILAADSGRSIFLEEKVVQRGRVKSFRWEIPYPFLMSLRESALQDPEPAANPEAQPDAAEDASPPQEKSPAATHPSCRCVTAPTKPKSRTSAFLPIARPCSFRRTSGERTRSKKKGPRESTALRETGELRGYCLSYMETAWVFIPLASVPVVVTVRLLPSAEITTRVVLVTLPSFLLVIFSVCAFTNV